MFRRRVRDKNVRVSGTLRAHFGERPLETIVTASRTFPITARADLQRALETVFDERPSARLLGVHPQYTHDTVTFAHLARDGEYGVLVGPLQYDEVDTGDGAARRCLKHGLWLARAEDTPFSVLLAPAERYGHTEGVHVEIAVPAGETGHELSRRYFDELERLINESGSYRGKVISLEQSHIYSGRAGAVKVHRLHTVRREDVILPEKTLRLLDRNVTEFVAQRESLSKLGMPTKKGLLFYGSPGTGKTHTIHYLASELPNHTTLLVTAEQVGLLDDYFQLARFLQPAMIVIEDVDLIAREREHMRNVCQEVLLNKLLNEMDGLREDAALLFVLTTNRPEHLEAALASRPGRIDQAIEFPLPDDEGRSKLIRLYSRGLSLPREVEGLIVKKTAGGSGAFIKELMRRCAQYQLRGVSNGSVCPRDVEAAMEEMLFGGGTLNRALLGATNCKP